MRRITSINRIRLEFKAENETKKTSVFVVLIESDWNLKEPDPEDEMKKLTSINRIRLEFKDVLQILGQQSIAVLIESDWNLKIRRYVINRRCILY